MLENKRYSIEGYSLAIRRTDSGYEVKSADDRLHPFVINVSVPYGRPVSEKYWDKRVYLHLRKTVVALVNDSDAVLHGVAAKAVGASAITEPILFEALKDPDSTVVVSAARLLIYVNGGLDAVPALIIMLGDNSKNADVRYWATELLAQICVPDLRQRL